MAEASVSIRLNPFKFRDVPGAQVPWNRYGRILQDRPSFTLDPLFHAGAYYVQDSSAMFPGHPNPQSPIPNPQSPIPN